MWVIERNRHGNRHAKSSTDSLRNKDDKIGWRRIIEVPYRMREVFGPRKVLVEVIERKRHRT